MKNYYQILGVAPTASADEVKEAYRKLSKRVHPDVNWGDKIFEELFKDINEAYKELSDEYRRADYNRKFQHFFFKQPISEEFVTQQRVETRRFFWRKMFINGGISVVLLCSVVTINAMYFGEKSHAENGDRLMAGVAPVDVSAAVNEMFFSKDESVRVSNVAFTANKTTEASATINTLPVDDIKPIVTNLDELNTAPSITDVKPVFAKEVKPVADYKVLSAAVVVEAPKPVIEKPVAKPLSTAPVAKEKPAAKEDLSTKVAKVSTEVTTKPVKTKPAKQSLPARNFGDIEMMNIAQQLDDRRALGINKTLSVRLVKAANSNILNAFDLAAYIREFGFPIAGRGLTSKSVKGIQITQSAACVTVTIGSMK